MIPFLVIVLMFWLLIVFTLFVSTPEEQEDVEFDRETIVAIEQSIATGQFGTAYSLAKSLRSAGLQKEMCSRVAENAISHLQAEVGATLTEPVSESQFFRLLLQTGFHSHRTLTPPKEDGADR